jgi:hypothetical protein
MKHMIAAAVASACVAAAGASQGGVFGRMSLPRPDGGPPVIAVQAKTIHQKAATATRLKRAATIKRLPGALANASQRQVAILKEDCQWTNDSVAACLVWDCDDDDVCVEFGQYCVDHYGKTIPCP